MSSKKGADKNDSPMEHKGIKAGGVIIRDGRLPGNSSRQSVVDQADGHGNHTDRPPLIHHKTFEKRLRK